MKIIIVGCGKVGRTIAEQLAKEKHDVTVIDTNYNKLREVTDSLDVMCIEGNGISSETLLEAGIDTADILIATTESDEKNVMCVLIAKNFGNIHGIARIRTPEYIPEIRLIKDELNMAMVINPDKEAALEIERILRYPSLIKRRDPFAKGRVDMLTIDLPENSPLEGVKIRDLSKVIQSDILICAVERDTEVYIPDGNFVLQNGDVISFVGTNSHQTAFFRQMKMETGIPKSVMIIGGSNIAYYLAASLEDSPMGVKIIEVDEEKCAELSEDLNKAIIINGDATDQQLLLEEGIENAGALITLTGIDEENIMVSLYASSVGNGRVVTKINRITFDNVISSLDIGSVINPRLITADHIIQYVRGMQNSLGSNVETLYKLVNGKAEALEFRVTSEFHKIGVKLMDLPLKKNLLIACIYRQGKVVIPRGGDHLAVGDTVIVVTTQTGLADLNDVLKQGI